MKINQCHMHSYIHVQEAHRLISKTNAVTGKIQGYNTQCSRDYRMTTANNIMVTMTETFKGG